MRGEIAQDKDTKKHMSLLSTPIECTLTLGELLRIIPHLWNNLKWTFKKMGVKAIDKEKVKILREENAIKKNVQPIPLNKVVDYCKGYNGNIALSIEYNNVTTLAIL